MSMLEDGLLTSVKLEEETVLEGKRKYDLAERVEQIKQAIQNGASTPYEIADKAGVSRKYLHELARKANIALPKAKIGRPPKSNYARLNKSIKRGLPVIKIAKIEGVSFQAIESYIKRTGQYEKWQQSRFWYKNAPKIKEQQRNNLICTMLNGVQERALDNSGDDEWALTKVLEYRASLKIVGYKTPSPDNLFTIFKRYYDAKKDAKSFTLEELNEGLGHSLMTISRILKVVGLKPMNGARQMHITPIEKKKAMKNAVKIKMPISDIEYFLGLPNSVLSQNLRLWNLTTKRPKVKNFIKMLSVREKRLNYRLASQIYEAEDARFFEGYSLDEMSEFFDVTPRIIDYALEHRAQISGKIIRALKILYPKREIIKPYKDFKD